jgi:coiled-coil domain-containing protein 130
VNGSNHFRSLCNRAGTTSSPSTFSDSHWRLILQDEKKRVAEETAEARRKGLGLRLLPASKEDAEAAARVRFGSSNGSGFDENRKKRRAAIRASSIFPAVKPDKEAAAEKRKTDGFDEKRRKAELLAKGRSIDAFGVSRLLSGSVKRSQPADGSRPSKKHAIAATVRGVS